MFDLLVDTFKFDWKGLLVQEREIYIDLSLQFGCLTVLKEIHRIQPLTPGAISEALDEGPDTR